jgi:hypothetical protein
MLNRFGLVAALAATLAFCGLCTAQEKDKKKAAKSVGPLPSIKMATEKPLTGSLSKSLTARFGEVPRDIEVGGGGGGIADPAALKKTIEDMGLETDGLWVSVNGAWVHVSMGDGNAWIIVQNRIPLKDPSNIPPERLLNLMEYNTPDVGTWAYISEQQQLWALGAVQAKSATKVALRRQLEGVARLLNTGIPIIRNAIKE